MRAPHPDCAGDPPQVRRIGAQHLRDRRDQTRRAGPSRRPVRAGKLALSLRCGDQRFAGEVQCGDASRRDRSAGVSRFGGTHARFSVLGERDRSSRPRPTEARHAGAATRPTGRERPGRSGTRGYGVRRSSDTRSVGAPGSLARFQPPSGLVFDHRPGHAFRLVLPCVVVRSPGRLSRGLSAGQCVSARVNAHERNARQTTPFLSTTRTDVLPAKNGGEYASRTVSAGRDHELRITDRSVQ